MKRVYIKLKDFNSMLDEYKMLNSKEEKIEWIDYKNKTYAIYLCYVFDWPPTDEGKREDAIGPFSEEPKNTEEIMTIIDNYLKL